MSLAESTPRAGFALRLEQGRGRLVLGPRGVGDLFTVDRLELALRSVPARLDLSAGVDRFRHHRGEVEVLQLHADDHDVGRWLRARAGERVFQDLELHASDGDLVVVGAVRGPRPAPFLLRARLAPASVAGDRAVLVSVYEARIYTPCAMTAPAVAREVLVAIGLEDALIGPTVAVLDPIDHLLFEVCAELGWKVPGRDELRLSDIGASGGQVRLSAGRKATRRLGPQGLAGIIEDGGARGRRFLADYEAKSLFQAIEALVAEGHHERAIRAYERQLDLHPDHPFVSGRLMQLYGADPHAGADAMALARARLNQADDDPDGLATLAVVQARRGVAGEAADSLARLARSAERQGESAEAAQALWARAVVLAPEDPRGAIAALEGALALRRRLPGALRALSDLYGRVGDWAAALHTRERLLAGEAEPSRRRALLLELGALALNEAGAIEAAAAYFEQVLADQPDDIAALDGLARAHQQAGRLLPAVRSLDRATHILQQRGDAEGAAARMVQLGQLWRAVPDEGHATAALRFRQALTLVPGHVDALLGLADAAEAGGDAGRARAHLEEALRATEGRPDDPQRVEIHLRLGALFATRLDAPDRAVVAYQKALRGSAKQVRAAVEALDALFSRQGRAEDLARVLGLAAQATHEPAARGAVLARLAEVVATLGDGARARSLLAEAAALRPGDPKVLAARVNALRASDAPVELVDALWALAQITDEPREVAELQAERGRLLLRRLNRADEAVEAFGLALGAHPGHAEALRGLADIEREREHHTALARLLAELSQVAPAAERPAVLLELGRLEVEVLDEPARAVGRFEAVVKAWPDDPEPRRRLADLYLTLGRAADALRQLEAVERLYVEEGWAEPQGPFHLAAARAHQGAGQAREALERLASAVAVDPDLEAAHALARDLMLEQGDLPAIVDWSAQGAAKARAPAVRARLLATAGRLAWRELKQAARAAGLLDEALSLTPDDAALGRLRLEVATALGDWATVDARLRGLLEQAAERNQPALLTRLATLSFGALEQPAEGFALLERALALRADYAPALGLLAEQSALRGEWGRARTALERLVATPAAGAADHLALARAELMAGAPSAARRRLDGLPESTRESAAWLTLSAQVTQALEAAAVDRPVAPPATAVPPASADTKVGAPAPEPDADAVLLAPTSDEQSVDGAGEAVVAPDAAAGLPAPPATQAGAPPAPPLPATEPPPPMDAAPTSSAPPARQPPETSVPPGAALDSIDELLAAMDGGDDSSERTAEALRQAAETAAPGAAADAWLAVAEHRRDVLRDPQGAEADFIRVLDVGVPTEPAWGEAMEALEDLYALGQRWDGLLALYDRRIVAGVDPAAEIELLKASVLRAAGRLDEALAAAEAARSAGPRATELLVSLLVDGGRRADAAQALLADVDELAPDEAAHRRWRAAELHFAEDPERALNLFRAAAQRLRDPELIEAWGDAAEQADDGEALVAVAEARARALPDQGPHRLRRSSAFVQAAALARERGLDPAWQISLLGEALAAWADNPEALEALAEIQRQTGDHAGLRHTLMAQIEAALPGPTRGELALALAKLHLAHGEGPEAAQPYLQQAIAELGSGATAEIARQLLTGGPAAHAPEGPSVAALWVESNSTAAADGGDLAAAVAAATPGPERAAAALRWARAASDVAEGLEGYLLVLAEPGAGEAALSAAVDDLVATGAEALAAVDAARHLAEQTGGGIRLAALRCWVACVQGRSADASHAHALVVDEPDEPVARWVAARLALSDGDQTTARDHLLVALTAGPPEALPLPAGAATQAFAMLIELAEDGADAERLTESLLDERPPLIPALGWLRARWAGSSQWPRLLERLDAARAVEPTAIDVLWWRVELLAGPADEAALAGEGLAELLAASPEHAAARRLAYGLAAARGAWDEALHHVEATLSPPSGAGVRLLHDLLDHAPGGWAPLAAALTRWAGQPHLTDSLSAWVAEASPAQPWRTPVVEALEAQAE